MLTLTSSVSCGVTLTNVVCLFPGKTNNNKDICGDDKHKEDGDPWNVEAQAAFLGPNLWDKTLPYDTDLKVHQVSWLICVEISHEPHYLHFFPPPKSG